MHVTVDSDQMNRTMCACNCNASVVIKNNYFNFMLLEHIMGSFNSDTDKSALAEKSYKYV